MTRGLVLVLALTGCNACALDPQCERDLGGKDIGLGLCRIEDRGAVPTKDVELTRALHLFIADQGEDSPGRHDVQLVFDPKDFYCGMEVSPDTGQCCGVYDGMGIRTTRRVADVCLADTAFIHELGHYLGDGVFGDVDPDHGRLDWWGPAGRVARVEVEYRKQFCE